MEVKTLDSAFRVNQVGGEGMEMRFVAGRDLEGRRIDLDEIIGGKESAQRRLDPVARQKKGPAVRMNMRSPPFGG
jgi:hypothetical protein